MPAQNLYCGGEELTAICKKRLYARYAMKALNLTLRETNFLYENFTSGVLQ